MLGPSGMIHDFPNFPSVIRHIFKENRKVPDHLLCITRRRTDLAVSWFLMPCVTFSRSPGIGQLLLFRGF